MKDWRANAAYFTDLGRMAQAAAGQTRSDRLRAAGCAALFQLGIGYVLVTGLNFEIVARAADELKVFTVPAQPPPPPAVEKVTPAPPSEEPEGEGSPPDLIARPVPVIAPPPRVDLEIPPPVTAAPIVSPDGPDPDLGAATVPGPGIGRGGTGDGPGTGSGGNGRGGAGVRAQRVKGALRDSDYPGAAARVRAAGTVFIRFVVQTDGRAEACEVTRTSGFAVLDETTCRLVERRFRYRPARDAAGQKVPEVVTTNFTWGTRITY